MNISDYKYKIELHAHTWPVSGCGDLFPEEMVAAYRAAGVDAVVLTNHFYADKDMDKYMEAFYKAKARGEHFGITVILGMEFRDDTDHDYLVYGIDEEFVRASHKYACGPYNKFYDDMKNDKNVMMYAHPFRDKWRDLGDDRLDGIEVFNLHEGNNSRIGMAARYAQEHDFSDKIVSCGTDFHELPFQALVLLRTKTLPQDSFELAEILKSRDYLIDISGNIIIPYGFKEA